MTLEVSITYYNRSLRIVCSIINYNIISIGIRFESIRRLIIINTHHLIEASIVLLFILFLFRIERNLFIIHIHEYKTLINATGGRGAFQKK